jgi:polyhydroxybutyrate depolymerase
MKQCAVLWVLLSACAVQRAPAHGAKDALKAGDDGEFVVPGFDKRDWLVHVPEKWDGKSALPVVMALHGGAGHADSARKLTCAGGNEGDASCLDALADKEGFATVYPNGVPGDPIEDARTWNAGGGDAGFQCVSGSACSSASDDVKYVDTVIAEVSRALVVDDDRVFATGISDGGAMVERMACELSTKIASIAPVAAGNQVAEVQGCDSIARAIPVLEIHGTKDPCWNFVQGKGACLQNDGGVKVGVDETMKGWIARDGCTGSVTTTAVADADKSDGTTTTRETHSGCVDGGVVELLKVDGGGHTWPGGFQYDFEGTIGKTSKDFSATDEIWNFFKAHPRPTPE